MGFWNMRNELKIFIRNLKCRYHIYGIWKLMNGLHYYRFWRKNVWSFGWNSSGSGYGEGLRRQKASIFQVLSNQSFVYRAVFIIGHWLCSRCPCSSALKIMTDSEENNPVPKEDNPIPEEHKPSPNATVDKSHWSSLVIFVSFGSVAAVEFRCLVYRYQRFG